ncbi:MAG: hypothetical protein E7253_11165 [Lachnospiraceae bacterium]|nr:hypothetical protein [Lachnospiraceae bacterium]
MKKSKLMMLNFMALSIVLGLVSKKMMNPFANLITEALHIPGGISTGFSIMFLVIAAEIIKFSCYDSYDGMADKCGILMGTVQGLVALALGRVGSMGILMPIGFMATGFAIDLVYRIAKRIDCSRRERMVIANSFAALMASVTANIIVFRLWGPVLMLYLCVSAVSGMMYGFLAASVALRVQPIFYQYSY